MMRELGKQGAFREREGAWHLGGKPLGPDLSSSLLVRLERAALT